MYYICAICCHQIEQIILIIKREWPEVLHLNVNIYHQMHQVFKKATVLISPVELK